MDFKVMIVVLLLLLLSFDFLSPQVHILYYLHIQVVCPSIIKC